MKVIQFGVYVLLMSLALHVFLRLTGLHWLELLDPASVFFVLASLPFVLLSYRFSELIKALMQGMGLIPEAQSPLLSYQIVGALATQMLIAGGISSLLGIVQALANLDDVKLLGTSLAISLLGLLYAMGAYLLFWLPMRTYLQRERLSLEHGGEGL